MKAAQPVNAQSTAVGVTIRKVIVEQVVPEKGVAIVRDGQQYTTEIPYRVQQGRGRIPEVGDYWYVDRSMGPWIFSAYIGKSDADFNTFNQGLIVPSGQKITQGPVPSTTTAILASRVPLATSATMATGVDGDGTSRFVIFGDGKQEWGPGGSGSGAVRDVNLYRSAADTLRTDDNLSVGGAIVRTVFTNTATSAFELVTAANVDASIITVSATFKNGYAYRISYHFRTQHNGGAGPSYVCGPKLKRVNASGTTFYSPGSLACIGTNFMGHHGHCEVKNTSGADHTQTVVLTGSMSTTGGATSMDIEGSAQSPTTICVEVLGLASQYPGAIEVPTA